MDSVTGAAAPPAAQRLGRRTYVVDRRFQYKYSLLLSALGAVISIVFGALMYVAHRDALEELLSGAAMPAHVAARSATLLWLIVGTAILMAVALGLFGVLVTHRVAGPVYVMSLYAAMLARGRYPILRPLRRTDELRDLFQHFQNAIATLRERESSEAGVLERAIERLGAGATSPELRESLEELRAMAARKREALTPTPPTPLTRKSAA